MSKHGQITNKTNLYSVDLIWIRLLQNVERLLGKGGLMTSRTEILKMVSQIPKNAECVLAFKDQHGVGVTTSLTKGSNAEHELYLEVMAAMMHLICGKSLTKEEFANVVHKAVENYSDRGNS